MHTNLNQWQSQDFELGGGGGEGEPGARPQFIIIIFWGGHKIVTSHKKGLHVWAEKQKKKKRYNIYLLRRQLGGKN